MSPNLHPMINVAIKAARAAGSIINRAALDVEAVRISQKQVNDFVTEVDHAAENAIIETLLTAYPGHGIHAEESGKEHGAKDSNSSGSSIRWTAPPISSTACRSTASALDWPSRARLSKRSSTTRRAMTSSLPPKAAAPT